mgnify:FL=1
MNEKERLIQVMQSEGLNAKQFADRIGVSAGTLSNIINERNKPSLEVFQKVLDSFRIISPDWLISGIGPMYRQKNDSQQLVLIDVKPETNSFAESLPENSTIKNKQNKTNNQQFLEKTTTNNKKIQKVLVFFTDGSYEEISA